MAMLDMLEGMLGLDDQDKATVAAAAPIIDKWVVMLNQQWDTLSNAVGWLTNSRPVADRLIADGKVLAPIAHDVLAGGGGIFEMGQAMSAVKDAQAVINANPQLLQALNIDYNKLAPLLKQVQSDMDKPQVKAAIDLIQSKMHQRSVSAGQLMEGVLHEAAKAQSSA